MRHSKTTYSFEESLGHLTSQASRMILKRINQELSRRGLPITSDQFSTLVYVWNQNGQPQYTLAESLNKDKTTMTRMLAGLESSGLIVRLPGNTDAREKNVFLTDRGNQMMQDVTQVVQEVLENAMSGIDESEIEMCKNVLRKFYGNLCSL
ncbi:MarR family winged helix-turn-helix transcriptional regulator [Geobacter sp. AOG1]|uniref:MarR family winged helix-turn-helix transcriptional regulator n=1 Tax=Geobacter sp. AOG1 TaxID=1566346 RepID=UPI001CC54628|nr:MarR family transcriptional regulator [Geobacter sp. AOG1]